VTSSGQQLLLSPVKSQGCFRSCTTKMALEMPQ